MIKHDLHVWSVVITRRDGSRFLACDKYGPVATWFSRASAVEHAKELLGHGFIDPLPVRVRLTIEQTAKPSRRGM